jgi:hypothetical protein
VRTASREIGIGYTYCSESRQLLVDRGWIDVKGKETRLIMGFDSSEIVSENQKQSALESFGKTETIEVKVSEKPKQIVSENQKPSPVVLSKVSENQKPSFGKSEIPYIEPTIEPIKKDRLQKPDEPELPEWLPKELWSEWSQYRKELRKKLTPSTVRKQITLLDTLRGQGQSVEAVIQQSIEHGWQGLFAVKNANGVNGNGRGFQTKQDQALEFGRANAEQERKFIRDAGWNLSGEPIPNNPKKS